MADPVSTLATALQIADVAAGVGIRIARFIHDLKEVDVTTTDLLQKLDHLRGVVVAIETLMKRRHAQNSRSIGEDESKTLSTTQSLLKSCSNDIDAFAEFLTPLKQSRKGAGMQRLATQMSATARLEWNERYISRLGDKIQGNIVLLQTLCTCSEVAIQGDAVYRLAGSNDDIARNQARMQSDIARLRSAMETLTYGKPRGPDTPTSLSTVIESFEEVEQEEDILERMKTAIEVTESLCDKVSSMGSVSDIASSRAEQQRDSSNASAIDADLDRNRLILAQTQIATPDTPQSSFATAESVLDDVPITRLGSPDSQGIDFIDTGNRLKATVPPYALPLPVMERMLENYQSQARQNMASPATQYAEAERDLYRCLEWGAKREQAHKIVFKERFDIVIELAKAQIGQEKFNAAEETLENLYHLVGQDQEKLGRWSCTSARLYQQWFDKDRDVKLLSKLEQFAIQSYNIASQPTSSKSTSSQRSLQESAEALIAFFAWNGDDVAVKTMCTLHPMASTPIDYVATQDVPGKPRATSKIPSSRARDSISEMLGPNVLERSRLQSNASGTPLDKATTTPETDDNLLLLAARSKSVDLVRYHVKREDIDIRDKKRRSALHLALLGAGGKDVVTILLENGADVNATDIRGTTPLHICAELDKPDMAAKLFEKGANVDAPSSSGETPLQLAVRKRKLHMVQCLLNNGATVEKISKHSGSQEIDFVIKEHLERLRQTPSRSGTLVGRFFNKRPAS